MSYTIGGTDGYKQSDTVTIDAYERPCPIGYSVFGFGVILVVAGFLGEPRLAAIRTGPTIGSYCLWAVLVARFFRSVECRL